MIHGEQFRRSVNIWKLTEGECRKDIYIDIYLWMRDMFKDLNSYISDKYPLSTFYGTSKNNILIEQDLKNDYNWIQHDKVYSVFKSKYKNYISDYDVIMDIFQEYLGNTLHLKGSRISHCPLDSFSYLGNDLHLKGDIPQ